MATLTELTDNIAARFNLGPKARVLIPELWGLIASQPDGADGFLGQVQAAGLAEKAATWLGDCYPRALSAREVEKAVGAEALKQIAENVGITEAIASKVLGYAIPRIMGLFAAGGSVSEAARARLRGPGSINPAAAPHAGHMTEDIPMEFRLVLPGAALLVTLGVFGYAISSGTAGDRATLRSAQGDRQNALVTPAPSNRTPLKSLAGAGQMTGDLAVTAGWTNNLMAAVHDFNSQDGKMPLAGYDSSPGGPIRQGDRDWMIGSLWSAQIPQFIVAAQTGSGVANLKLAASTPLAGSSGNETGNLPQQAALNRQSITFAADSAKVSARNVSLLRQVAEEIKQLPAGAVVQINGYTNGVGTSAKDMALSQQRADAVCQVLVREGVSPAMLKANGNGGAWPSYAGNSGELGEGRSNKVAGEGERERNNRRVDFHIIQQHM